MSAIAPIVINDGKATPVAHTFNPLSAVPPKYREAVASVPVIGQPYIDANIVLGKGTDGLNKATLVLAIPVLENVTGGTASGYTAAPKVAYFAQARLEFILPNRSDAATRKDLRVLASNLLSNAQVVDMIENLATPY